MVSGKVILRNNISLSHSVGHTVTEDILYAMDNKLQTDVIP